MTVFPNPASTLQDILIQFGEPVHGELRVLFLDSRGLQAYEEILHNADGITSFRIRLYHLKRGKYILKVQNDGREGTQKLIVQ